MVSLILKSINLNPILYPVLMYLFGVIPIYVYALKRRHRQAAFAFIPILQLWLLIDLAGLSGIYFVFLLIPLIQLIVFAFAWTMIAINLKKQTWVGWLTIVPYAGLFVPYFIIFAHRGLESSVVSD